MTKKNIIAGLILLVAGSLLIAACSGGQPPAAATATVDANAIYTQAAETVQAGMSQTQASQPTATIAPPTAEPTNTMDPAMAAGLTATANAVLQPGNTTPAAGQTPVAGATLAATATVVKLPTATSAVVAPPPASKGDKAELVDQSPKDGYSIQKKSSFDMTLVVKNAGTNTWNTNYKLAFFAGERMDSPQDFNMPRDVKPGETVKLVFTLKAPDSTGEKTIIWVMQNADGANFYPIYLKLNVTD